MAVVARRAAARAAEERVVAPVAEVARLAVAQAAEEVVAARMAEVAASAEGSRVTVAQVSTAAELTVVD